MDFDKRMKTRLILGIIYVLLGAAMWCCTFAGLYMNEFASSFQTVLMVIGIVNILRVVRMRKNPELYEKVRTAETDERNITIYIKASRLTLITCIYIAAASIIVLSMLGHSDTAQIISWCMLGVCAVHYLYVVILRRIY